MIAYAYLESKTLYQKSDSAGRGLPALVANDATEMLAVVRSVGTVEEVVVVGAASSRRDVIADVTTRDVIADVMVDVIVNGYDVDVTQANVDSNAGVTEPEEIGDLFGVGDVVGCLQLPG